MKNGVVRCKCPRCNGRIVISDLCQYSVDRKVLLNGTVGKTFRKVDCGSIDAHIAVCEECGFSWDDSEFIIDELNRFIDYKNI